MFDFPLLILSAGRRVELANLFVADAQKIGLKPHLFAADMSPATSAVCGIAEKAFRVPPIASSEYAEAILDICRREGVRLAVPTIDPELEPLAANRELFARAGTMLSVPESSFVEVARDKLLTAQRLKAAKLETPRTAPAADVLADPASWVWPLFVKPRKGSSSVGIGIIESTGALETAAQVRRDLIAQELLRGREYTINVFCMPDGACTTAIPHFRREVRGGEVSKGIVVDDPALRAIAREVVAAVPGAFGALCVQVMVGSGRPKVIEINARFGGGFPLAHRAGGHFTRWLLELAAGLPCTAHDEWREGTAMLRYDAAVFDDVPAGEARNAWLA